MNPMQIIQLIKQGQNPQQLVMMMLQQQANTPLGVNLLQLAQQGQTAEIEKIARNIQLSFVQGHFSPEKCNPFFIA